MCRRHHRHRGRPRLSLSRLQTARTRLVFRLKRRPRPQREDLGHRGGHALVEPLARQLKILGSSLEYLSLSAQFGYVGDPLTPLAAVAVGASTDTQRLEIIDVRTGRMSAVVNTHSAPQYSGAAFDRAREGSAADRRQRG